MEKHNKTIWQQPLVIRDLDGGKELEGAARGPRGILAVQGCRSCLCHSEKSHEKWPYSVQ